MLLVISHVRLILQPIVASPIGLPDGQSVVATVVGRVLLPRGLSLHHVLCVPSLTCNLISLSQLIDEINCIVHFSDSLCATQDLSSGNLIGAGERRDGLFTTFEGFLQFMQLMSRA